MADDPQDQIPAQGAHRPRLLEPQEAFRQLGRLPLGELPLSQVLARVAELARDTIPGADEVSVTLLQGDAARSVAFTGQLASALDERQYAEGFGPCMDAALAGEVISVADTASEQRYADFAAVAHRAGVRSSLSVGMPVPQRTVGGLNMYSRSPDAFDDEAVALARVFADYGAVAMLNAALLDSKDAMARQLEQAMLARATIEQAKGILMARLGCTPEEAFAHLSQQSQKANRKLRDIAADLVAQARRGTPPR